MNSRFLDIGNGSPLEVAHQPDNLILLRARDFGEHRQRQDPSLIGKRVRELPGPVLVAAVDLEERQRGRIVDGGLHAMGIEMRGQRESVRSP